MVAAALSFGFVLFSLAHLQWFGLGQLLYSVWYHCLVWSVLSTIRIGFGLPFLCTRRLYNISGLVWSILHPFTRNWFGNCNSLLCRQFTLWFGLVGLSTHFIHGIGLVIHSSAASSPCGLVWYVSTHSFWTGNLVWSPLTTLQPSGLVWPNRNNLIKNKPLNWL